MWTTGVTCPVSREEPLCSALDYTGRNFVSALCPGIRLRCVNMFDTTSWGADSTPSLFHHWHKKQSTAGGHWFQKKPKNNLTPKRRVSFHEALKCSAWWEKRETSAWQKTLSQAGQETVKKSSEKINSRFHWLTNQFGFQTRPEAEGQVCFQGEGSVGIWVSKCFNSTTVIAGCLRTTRSTNIKGQSAITLLLIP